MATLYKRATPAQRKLLRIIAGAYKNVCDAHDIEFDPRVAKSVAKRATGTVSSQWRELLAASSTESLPSEMARGSGDESPSAQQPERTASGKRRSTGGLNRKEGRLLPRLGVPHSGFYITESATWQAKLASLETSCATKHWWKCFASLL